MKNSLIKKLSGKFSVDPNDSPGPQPTSYVEWTEADFDRLINETWEAIHAAARSAPHSVDRPAPLTADDWSTIQEGDEIARRLIGERDMHRFRLHMAEYRERVLGMIAEAGAGIDGPRVSVVI